MVNTVRGYAFVKGWCPATISHTWLRIWTYVISWRGIEQAHTWIPTSLKVKALKLSHCWHLGEWKNVGRYVYLCG
jgi:hypothetical protein